jgi:CcmD family protein
VSTEEKYVAAVYLVVFLVLLAYVFIIALKLQRLERELVELAELAVKEREPAAQRPVRAERVPVEGVWGNREVPPAGSRSGNG